MESRRGIYRRHHKAHREERIARAVEGNKRRRAADPERFARYHKAYAETHAAEASAKTAQWRAEDPERARQSRRRSYVANRDKILAKNKSPEEKAKRQEYERQRRRRDPRFSLDDRMSAGIRDALGKRKAGRRWEAVLRFTLDDLIRHLERQFATGMSWENIGQWHVDHIRPRSSFQYETEADEQFHECWSLSNLRPLWAADNLRKHAKRELLL